VIDATRAEVAFSRVLGGRQRDMDMGRDVVPDREGNLYVVGNAASPDFPVTPGALDTTWGGGQFPSDAFVALFAPDGTLRASTFLGGPGFERAYAVELAADGDVVIAGRAGEGFPTTPGALQPAFGGDQRNRAPYGRQDGFVCRLAPDLRAVRFCTYLGTGDNGFIRDMDLDAEDNIVVVMGSTLGDLPAAWFTRAYQPRHRGVEDIVVAKLSADGGRMLWATYLGGSDVEVGAPSVRVAPDGSVLALLSTRSPDLPAPNGFDSTLSGPQDLYLARLSADGSRLLMGTYIGGHGVEAIETHGLALGPDGTIYVTGGTSSTDLPTTPGSYRPSAAEANNAFLMRIAPDGRLLASTYVGGRGLDYGEGIAVDSVGRVILTGYTESPDMLGVEGPDPGADLGDLFLGIFTPELDRLLYAARIGGSDRDMGRAATAAPGGWIALTGQTSSADWPVRNAPPPPGGGGVDGHVIRLRPLP